MSERIVQGLGFKLRTQLWGKNDRVFPAPSAGRTQGSRRRCSPAAHTARPLLQDSRCFWTLTRDKKIGDKKKVFRSTTHSPTLAADSRCFWTLTRDKKIGDKKKAFRSTTHSPTLKRQEEGVPQQ